MAGTRRLRHLVETATGRLDLPDGPLVIALSGGADSAALAFICHELGREARCVHINHGLPASSTMQAAAAAISDRLGLELNVRPVVIPEGPSPEGQARRARYSAFADVEGPLLTAHTRDDDVETVLFNVIRGTGSRGLTGIPYFRPHNVFRPMLAVTRSETREIASLAGLPFVDDPMNDDLSLTRNLLRSRVIPMLSELNPRLSESIARMAATVATDNQFLDAEAAKLRLVHGEESVGVALGDLKAVPKAMRDRALKSMLGYVLEPGAVTAERVEGLWAVATGEAESREVESGVVASLRGPLLVIETPRDWSGSQVVELSPGRHRQGRIEFEVVAAERVCKVVPLSRWAAIFPSGTALEAVSDGWVTADGEPAWRPGEKRLPVSWYEPGNVGYLSVFASEVTGWTSGH